LLAKSALPAKARPSSAPTRFIGGFETNNAKEITANSARAVKYEEIDPILAELWEIKRAINLEASFDVRKLAEAANQQNLAAILARGASPA
jgi:hypothetical protein